MYKYALVVLATVLLSACGSDDPSAEKTAVNESMQKATEHAKEAAKHLGNAVSETSKDLQEKWSEANKNRHVSEEDGPITPTPEVDMAALKEQYEQAKKKTIETYEEVKVIAIEKGGEAIDKVKAWQKSE